MNEDTLIKTMPLPFGQDWMWFADANVIVLSPHLGEDGRRRALLQVSAHWRRSCLRVLPPRQPNVVATTHQTQPLTTLAPVAR